MSRFSVSDPSSVVSGDGAIVLLSGGLDSTVALADILTRQPVACLLTFDYGQRAAKKELQATRAIADHYQLPHRAIALPWLAELLPQALTPLSVLKAHGVEAEVPASQEQLFDVNRVWVPNRNGLFLNVAACFAESLEVKTIVFGANAEEGASFPDNTPAFREQLNAVFAYSTLTGVRVETPVGHMDKAQIIRYGVDLDVPFHLVWSCYENADVQCGQCPSCIRVKNAQAQVAAKSGQATAIQFNQ
jgi:7-cyano-7-deazaguanine synthase